MTVSQSKRRDFVYSAEHNNWFRYLHLVVLTNCHGKEISITVGTETDRAVEIFREVAAEKAKRRLVGYTISEIMEIEGLPF